MQPRSGVAHFLVLAAVVAMTSLSPRVAHADSRAQAEMLFQQGKAAMARKEYEKACALFADSLKLEDTAGTLLNLAACHEEIGKVATAWGEFAAVEQRALRADPPQEERAKYANQHVVALKPRLSFVKIVVLPEAKVEGLEVLVDDVAEPEALWEGGVPVDPGTRKVSARAPGKNPWVSSVRVDDENVTVVAKIHALTDAPKVVAPKQGVDVMDMEAIANARARRTAGFIVGGIGVAGLISTGIFGGLAIASQSNESKDCSQNNCYKALPNVPASQSYLNAANDKASASTYANVANVTTGIAVVGVAVGAYLIFTANAAGAPAKKSARIDFAPSVSKDGGGFAAFGAF